MTRGEVWWADLEPPAGRRPVVLLTRETAYDSRALITIAPLTTRIRRLRVEVPLGPSDGLPRVCVANLDTITTIGKWRLRESIAALSPEKIQLMNGALRFALGLEE
jgi:mRNA interferase MazF